MLKAENTKNIETGDAELRRLVWRCRRGLLELDLILQNFVNTEFKQLDFDELIAFNALLDWPDNDFWDVINHPEVINDCVMLSLITKIKQS